MIITFIYPQIISADIFLTSLFILGLFFVIILHILELILLQYFVLGVIYVLKKILSLILALNITFAFGVTVFAEGDGDTADTSSLSEYSTNARSAVLIDAVSGKVLYEKNSHEQLPPASVTKIMTMALVLEQVSQGKISYEDMVTASENASSMGGSQIYLEVGEQMSLYDIMMSIAVASANDSAVAAAEFIAGDELSFVDLMNTRAKELGMVDTNFLNPSGLPEDNHYTSAYDIALMSKYFLSFKDATQFTSTNLYPIREGERQYVMRNSNELVRSYDGCIGIKTGYTEAAKYCLSAAATKNGMTIIGVILGSDTIKERNSDMESLLDWGFDNFCTYTPEIEDITLDDVKVIRGMSDTVKLKKPKIELEPMMIKKGEKPTVDYSINLSEEVTAPVDKNQVVGEIVVTVDGEEVYKEDILTAQSVAKRSWFKSFVMLLKKMITM